MQQRSKGLPLREGECLDLPSVRLVSTSLVHRAVTLAHESANARAKLAELEARSQAMQARSNEEQARYAKEMGAAQRHIADLEGLIRKAKGETEVALRTAMEANASLSLELKSVHQSLEASYRDQAAAKKRIFDLEGLLAKLLGMRMAESEAWTTVEDIVKNQRPSNQSTMGPSKEKGKDTNIAPVWLSNAVEVKPLTTRYRDN